MGKMVATAKGYFGGLIREPGAVFPVPDEIMDDPKRCPSWATPYGTVTAAAAVQTAKAAAAASAGAEATAAVVAVPADWQQRKVQERKALAKAITGKNPANVADADAVIANYLKTTKPEVFSDAPAPEVVAGEKAVATGGPQPDWVAPDGSPKAVTE